MQFLWRAYEERLEPARVKVARFVGARPQDLVFVPNATTAINAVLGSYQFRRGDELLTTNHDYNACHNVLVERARHAGSARRAGVGAVPVREWRRGARGGSGRGNPANATGYDRPRDELDGVGVPGRAARSASWKHAGWIPWSTGLTRPGWCR